MGIKALRARLDLPVWTGPKLPRPPTRDLGDGFFHCSRSMSTVDTIIVHATAGSSSQGAYSVIKARRASWHYLIPDENEPEHGRWGLRCTPEQYAAYHVLKKCVHPADGRKNINLRSLGIEIVNAQTESDKFSEWQVRYTAQLCAYWWSVYPIRWIFTHAYIDPTRKLDPGHLFPWDMFVKEVLSYKGQYVVVIDKQRPAPNNVVGTAIVEQGRAYLSPAALAAFYGLDYTKVYDAWGGKVPVRQFFEEQGRNVTAMINQGLIVVE